ncbi:toxin-antitoxin system YwqK family antitoxin [Bacteroides sp. 519]|uniref:toxin-antitoxin system YwqK family antitoxin n=1 Tax=Bacteroides sp. 519 TaxID=2302937 RepID=UPI0013D03098|nr:hypothetical protein [Bacteroides sp. 519]NDV57368.1 hypothetical protein [Bacteroides sp. 519]
MKIKLYFIAFFISMNLFSAYAQMEGGDYKGFLIKKDQELPDIITIRVLELGNYISQYSEVETGKPLNGTYHIVVNRVKYNIGNFTKGIVNGDWEEYRYNSLAEKGTYKNGRPDGDYCYYSDGYVETRHTYKNGTSVHRISHHANGKVSEEFSYDNEGKIHGNRVRYNNEGILIASKGYAHGKYHGKHFEMDSQGQTTTSHYEHGQQVGDYSIHYANGNIREKGTYNKNGEKIGKWIFAQENGDIKQEITYLNDKRHGQEKSYYKGNIVKSIVEYANGKRNGKSTYYDESPNTIENEGDYQDDKPHGVHKVYHKGILWKETLYRHGEAIQEKQYEDGKIKLLMLLDETGRLVNVQQYNKAGEKTYKNTTYKKHPSIQLKEDDSGIVDIEFN